jgi:hypothetical protein
MAEECAEIGCNRPAQARGYCAKHYQALRQRRLRAQGLCISCGTTPASPGHVRCLVCADVNDSFAAASMQKAREKRKASHAS